MRRCTLKPNKSAKFQGLSLCLNSKKKRKRKRKKKKEEEEKVKNFCAYRHFLPFPCMYLHDFLVSGVI